MDDSRPPAPPTYEDACQIRTDGVRDEQAEDTNPTHAQSQPLLEKSEEGLHTPPHPQYPPHQSPNYMTQQYASDQTQGYFVGSQPEHGYEMPPAYAGYTHIQYGYPAPAVPGQPYANQVLYGHAHAGPPVSATFYPGQSQPQPCYPPPVGAGSQMPYNTHPGPGYQSAVFSKACVPGSESNVILVQPTTAVVNGVITSPEPPQTYFWLACLTCLCCFWPLGLSAVVCSCMSSTAIGRGDYRAAENKANISLKLSLASIAVGLVLLGLFFWMEFVKN